MKRALVVAALLFSIAPQAFAKAKPAKDEPKKDDGPLSSATFAGLTLRSIGPALTSGRIADLAVDPTDAKVWWVGAASGGVWKIDQLRHHLDIRSSTAKARTRSAP